MMARLSRHNVYAVGVLCLRGALIFGFGFLVAHLWRGAGAPSAPIPTAAASQNGMYLNFVFLGSPSCLVATDKSLFVEVRQIIARLRAVADRQQVGFRTVGVAVGGDSQTEVDYLGDLGEFDEIVAGGSWLNNAASRYVWDNFPGHASTPQLIVTTKSVAEADLGNYSATEQVVIRSQGAEEIAELNLLLRHAGIDSLATILGVPTISESEIATAELNN